MTKNIFITGKTFKIFLIIVMLCFGFILSVWTAFAAEASKPSKDSIELLMPFDKDNPTIKITGDNVTSFTIISDYVAMIYKFGAVVVTLLAVLMIVVWGVQYSLYGVDPAMKDDAKERIKQALIALTLLLLSALILRTINPTFFTF